MRRRLRAQAGSGKEPAGERGCPVNLDKCFLSNRLQQEQTNGFTLASAKEEIRKEIGGHEIEQVEAGSCLIHSSGCPCRPGRWRALSCRFSWC